MWTEQTWLTTTLRPAGLLDSEAVERLGESVAVLSATCDLVVLDLSVATIADTDRLAALLRVPAARLAREGGCLLLRGAGPEVTGAMSAAPLSAVG